MSDRPNVLCCCADELYDLRELLEQWMEQTADRALTMYRQNLRYHRRQA